MSTKNPVLLIAFLCLFITAGAQVKFRNISVPEAFTLAREEDKIVFVYLVSEECTQCNEVATQGFEDAAYGRAVNNSAIPLWVTPGSKSFSDLDSMFHMGPGFGQLFIHSNGSLLYRYAGSSSAMFMNMRHLENALGKKANPDTEFMELQKEYNAGKREFDQLYKLAAKKNAFDMAHDQITDEMVDLAPKDSARSVTFIKFVAEQAPLVDSKASRYIRKDYRVFNEAWYLMPLQKRAQINRVLIAKSKAKAIREKDLRYAEQVAEYTAGTYSDARDARRNYERTLVDYYRGVKDTANYLLASVKYYDNYLMTISVDSMKKVDADRQAKLMGGSSMDKAITQNGAVRQEMVNFAPATQYYTGELNTAAWTVYIMTRDPYYNSKALEWAKRANEFYEQPASLDTYARLLYRTGNKADAIFIEEKLIEFSRERRAPTREYEEVLAKMKTGGASIDKY
jgi:hypothetical protein